MNRLMQEHDANNAFVKKQQNELLSMGAKNPNLNEDCMKFDAHMTNTGEHAKSFASELTSGMDKKAFPVK